MADVDHAKLARLLRECAAYVERNEFHPNMYHLLGDLNAYAGKHQNNSSSSNSNNQHTTHATQVTKSNPFGAFGGITKTLGKIGLTHTEKEQRKATSTKNADRVKSDLEELKTGEDDTWSSWWTGGATGGGSVTERPSGPAKPGKPAFQRPTNPKSTLVANGWIEQQRRSKMRVVWKDVLCSLVEGRKATEETTLWIQREVTNSTTGKQELEALHQVPIKWLEEVQYLDFYGDHRFSLKVYNVSEEFIFRCADEGAAQNWVVTLRSVKEENAKNQQETTPKAPSIAAAAAATPVVSTSTNAPFDEPDPEATAISPSAPVEPTVTEQPRMKVSEMRAIAHGAGVTTHGMERSDLERVVAEILAKEVVTKAAATKKTDDITRQQEIEAARRREELERQEQLRRVAENEAKAAGIDDEQRRKLEEAQAQRVAEARRMAEEDEKRRQAAILEEQRRSAAIAEERRRVDEQRRLAEEQRRLAEEQRRQTAVAEEQRRRLAEQQAAEQLRRQEEERHRAQQQYQQQQQQWQQQQAAQQQWQAQQAAAAQQRAQAAQQAQWQQWQQQQQQQQQQKQKTQSIPQQTQQPPHPFGNTAQPGPPPAAPSDPTSTADIKYTKMAEESNGEEQIGAVKRNILTHWALQPPALQHLRSIAELLITIHTVFPPAFGVASHDYFGKWTAVSRNDLIPVGAGPDEEKLKKAVKKLRFFLHPDKLPRDLNDEQQFMCRMLWDISSDAWEEFKKRHEELDWIQN